MLLSLACAYVCPRSNSDGFDAKGTTTGFVLWMNRHGIMVDPPPHFGSILKKHGISARLMRGIILTHCHADHDAGTFQKILEEGRVVVMTTSHTRQGWDGTEATAPANTLQCHTATIADMVYCFDVHVWFCQAGRGRWRALLDACHV